VNVPEELRYTKDHEWARLEDAGRLRVGITDYAQDALGDVVFVQLPEVGADVTADGTMAEIESTKSVSDV
jgi:glycine cleavage system H protein